MTPRLFLFTDIEGSTALWQSRPEAMRRLLPRHDELVAGEVAACGGEVVKHTGDGFFCVFHRPSSAAECAVRIQRGLSALKREDGVTLRVRIGLHLGEADRRGDDYFGPGVSRAARVTEAGNGGQVLLSRGAAGVCRIPSGVDVIEHGPQMLRDLEAPVELLELRLRGAGEAAARPLRTLAEVPNNLPEQATLFVGRRQELSRLSEMLADPAARLVTIHGHGGCGKTRLALHAAAETALEFPRGAWLVALEEVETPGMVPASVEEAMGLEVAGDEEGLERIVSALAGAPSLLVLDNFEHLAEHSDFPARLLKRAPEVTVLVTSRWRLGLREEQLLPLSGLGWPGDGRCDSGRCESVELFTQTARRLGRGEDWGDSDMDAVRRVCAALEGNPLAIELAASWTRLMDPPEIEADLGALLREDGAIRGLPDRHRSVMAVFSYSWNLLSGETAAALVALAVFRGRFHRAEAREVAGAGLAVLSRLMDLSLLRRDGKGLRLHGLVRRFALEKAAEAGLDLDSVKRKHCRLFNGIADGLTEPLMKRHDEEAIRKLGSRLDDVMAGWRFAVGARDAALAMGYIHSLKTYFAARGLYAEGQSVFLEAAEELEGGGDLRRLRGFALSYASWFRCHSSYDRETTRLAERSVAVLREAGDPWGLALALNHLGNLHYVSGRYGESRKALEESLRLREDIGDRWGETCSLNNLGNLACECDDLEGAERIYRRCARLFEEMGDYHGVSVALANLGATAQLRGDLQESMRYLKRAYAIEEDRGARFGMALVRAGMAEVLVAEGRPDEAIGMFEQSRKDFTDLGNRWGEVRSLLGLAEAAVALGEKDRALKLLRRCVGGSEGRGWEPLRNQMAQACAELLEAAGRSGRASDLAAMVLEDGSTSKRVRIRASDLLARVGPADGAAQWKGIAQEMAEALDELDGKV